MKVCSIKVHICFWAAFRVLWPSSQLPGVPGGPEQEVPDPTDSGHLQ